ncbi:MAG: WxcM-like domain-containing protein, partial [Pseudomonadota bacterium]
MDRVSFIDLPTHVDPRGALTAADGGSDLPFEIRRMFLLHDMPQGAARAAHAHRHLHEAIFAAHGGFRVRLDDGRET